MPGRISVTGNIDTGNRIRVTDDYSDHAPAVEVEPFWCERSEEIKFRIRLLVDKADAEGVELVWNGICLKNGDTRVVLEQK